MTSAPISASNMPQYGPAATLHTSITCMPARGSWPAIAHSFQKAWTAVRGFGRATGRCDRPVKHGFAAEQTARSGGIIGDKNPIFTCPQVHSRPTSQVRRPRGYGAGLASSLALQHHQLAPSAPGSKTPMQAMKIGERHVESGAARLDEKHSPHPPSTPHHKT